MFIAYLRSSFCSQKGAMFGIDARIALIIASVLAAATGVAMMSRLDSNKREAAERGVLTLREGLENHYKTAGITTLAGSIGALISGGYVEDSTLSADPWGASWNYNTASTTMTIEGIPVTVNVAIIHSSGADGVNDSTNIANISQYNAWVPTNDDIGIKFSSIEIEKDRVRRYRTQSQLITDKLEAQEAGRYLYATNICTATPADAICTSGSTSYTQYNYYPRSDLDGGAAVYFDPTVSGDFQTYTAGDSSDMQQLMNDVGLPSEYATDPWNRILYYDSNVTDRTSPPYTAGICFTSGGSCF